MRTIPTLFLACWLLAAGSSCPGQIFNPPTDADSRPHNNMITPEERAALRQSADAALRRAMIKSSEAKDETLATFAALFEDAKKGAPGFADEVLGFGGKAQSLTHTFEEGVVAALKGAAILFGEAEGLDDFHAETLQKFARECFDRHVLDLGRLEEEIASEIQTLALRLEEIETELLIELLVDLPDTEIPLPPLPAWEHGQLIGNAFDGHVDAMAATALKEAAVSLARFGISWVAGDAVQDHIPGLKTRPLARVGAGIAADLAAEKAMDAGLQSLGHDPRSRLIALAERTLDDLKSKVLEGNRTDGEVALEALLWLNSIYHPAPEIRRLTREAARRLRWFDDTGLNRHCDAFHLDWLSGIAESLARWIDGPSSLPYFGPYNETIARPTQELVDLSHLVIESDDRYRAKLESIDRKYGVAP